MLARPILLREERFMDPQATAGRIVHYHIPGGQKRAAIVGADTAPDGTACLTVFYDTGPVVTFGVPYSEEPKDGCWSWMPYQHAKAETDRGNESESAELAPKKRSKRAKKTAPAGSVDAGAGVPSDPVGGPTAGVPADEPAAGPTQKDAVVDGDGEALEPAKETDDE
jgi:hypothetical protein